MKYIEILEDIEFYNLKKGDVYTINKKSKSQNWLESKIESEFGLISSIIAGAVVHAGKAKFLDEKTVRIMARNCLIRKRKEKANAINANKKDTTLNPDSDSIILEEDN